MGEQRCASNGEMNFITIGGTPFPYEGSTVLETGSASEVQNSVVRYSL